MRRFLVVLTGLALAVVTSVPGVGAHSGGIDSNGGHYCRQAGYDAGKCSPLGSYHSHGSQPPPSPPPPPPSRATARALLSRLPVTAEVGSTTYDRSSFSHWIDADGDCQDTRAEVLIAEMTQHITFTTAAKCTVATGSWLSWYDGGLWTLASDVDVDHVIPLKEAWESGARTWTASRRRDFANDLAFAATLDAVTDNVNQSKGDRDPAGWLPPLTGARCDYAIRWTQVKVRWRLTIDTAERNALSSILTGACGNRTVESPPVVK
jgi:hypothetical protein